MTKNQLAEKIRRRLGYPMIKVELDDTQIFDAIDYARSKFIKWGVGNATQEVYFTKALVASQYMYDLPGGVTEVLSYSSVGSSEGGINTLFTVDNFLYNHGMFDLLINAYGSNDYSIVSYHIARDFLETVKRYTPDRYNFKYHKYTNQLEIQPPPPSGGSLTYIPRYATEDGIEVSGEEVTIDSPGWILVRCYMLQGSTSSPSWTANDTYEDFYESAQWIEDYATAYCKKILGMIRRKFASFGSLGNQGIALDGGELISEADAEMEKLKEDLRLEENFEGYGISIG